MVTMIKHDELISKIETVQGYEEDVRDEGRDSIHFIEKPDGQWEYEIIQKMDKRPRYTFDKTSPVVDQICSDIEQAEFTIRSRPTGDFEDNSKIFDGLIRQIMSHSSGERIIKQASRQNVISGMASWEVVSDYLTSDSFDQDLVIKPIHNALDRVYWDPNSMEEDHSDAKWCVVLTFVEREAYEKMYPKNKNDQGVDEGRETHAYWDKADGVVIGKLYWKEPKNVDLVEMSDGKVYYADDPDFIRLQDEMMMSEITEARRRAVKKDYVYSRLFNGQNWLNDKQETVFCERIPVVTIYGNFNVTENKRIFRGVVTKMKDPQRVYNYATSRQIEEGALSPREKVWMTREQAAGNTSKLATLNQNADPVQFYEHVDGQQPPFKMPANVVNPGLQQIAAQMNNDITESAGMFAASMGDNPNIQSGVALEQLQDKGDNMSQKWFDALEVGINTTGAILVDAIPRVYDSTRTIRILNEDGTHEMQTLYTTAVDQQTGQVVEINNLAAGKYDIYIEMGKDYKSKKRESAQRIIDLATIDPTMLEYSRDLIMDAMDAPGMDLAAERVRQGMLQAGLIPQDQMTEEELQAAQAAAQQPPPEDPNMVLARAEELKGQADVTNAQTKQMETQARMQSDFAKIEMDNQRLQIEREQAILDKQKAEFDAMQKQGDQAIDAQKAKAEVDEKRASTAQKLAAAAKTKAEAEKIAAENDIQKSGVLNILERLQEGNIVPLDDNIRVFNEDTGEIE
jgi:hypothetical protein